MGFKKGQSGNPGGRPKAFVEAIEAARGHVPAAIKMLAKLMQDPKASASARIAAASEILDRAIGKPPQAVQMSGPDEGPIEHTIAPDADIAAALVQFFTRRAPKEPSK